MAHGPWILSLLIGALAVGCGTTGTSGADASLDAPSDTSATDSSTASDAGADAPSDSAAGDAGCGTGCRLFSVYCSTAPCTCLSLPSTEADPTCDAGTVSCTIDPCSGKTAACTSTGCEVQ